MRIPNRLAGNFVPQRHAFQILHDDKGLTIVLADLVDGTYVRVIQRRSGTRFAAEAFQRLRVLSVAFGQELQGDEADKFGVFGLVYHTHPAAAQFLDDSIVRDALADHLRKILRL